MKKYINNTLSKNNLEKAFENEALCHVKYKLWSDKAKNDGYAEISRWYEEASENELNHAKIWFDEMGASGSVNEMLQEATNDENHSAKMYLDFAAVAEDEGLDTLKDKFLNVSMVENNHKDKFSSMHNRFVSEEMFLSPDDKTEWKCYNCGFVHTGNTPPESCPLCARPETWFIPCV